MDSRRDNHSVQSTIDAGCLGYGCMVKNNNCHNSTNCGTHTAQLFFPCCVNPNVGLNRRTSHPRQVTALPGMRQGLGARDDLDHDAAQALVRAHLRRSVNLASYPPGQRRRRRRARLRTPSLASSPPPAMCMQRCVNPHSGNCDIFRGVARNGDIFRQQQREMS